MSKYNIYKSIIDKNIKKEFKDSDWCSSLMYYGTWEWNYLENLDYLLHFMKKENEILDKDFFEI